MKVLLFFLFLISIAFWIGSMFFFSLFTAPTVFKVLPQQQAGNLISHIFSKYYTVAYICGLIALITSSVIWFVENNGKRNIYLARVILILVMLVLMVIAGEIIRPKALEARAKLRELPSNSAGYLEKQKRFAKLHTVSVAINATVFLLGVTTVFITAYTIKE
ncbi:MAG: hypothetical protein KatS3mg078_0840 [Deltaproteobacteria bacterium]|jgi:uncharacterized membrane protein|nr:MAG: hypothetical protein KatS3mg078_0840 [Deltaproteobacteria bacterium]